MSQCSLSIVLSPEDQVVVERLACERLLVAGSGDAIRLLSASGATVDRARVGAAEASGQVLWVPDGVRFPASIVEEACRRATEADVAAVVVTAPSIGRDGSPASITELLVAAPPVGHLFFSRRALERVDSFRPERRAGWALDWLVRAVEQGEEIRWASLLSELPAADAAAIEALVEATPEVVESRLVELIDRQEELLGALLAGNHDRSRQIHAELWPRLAASREVSTRSTGRSNSADVSVDELTLARNEVAALRASWSWRLTAPLRWLGSWFVRREGR